MHCSAISTNREIGEASEVTTPSFPPSLIEAHAEWRLSPSSKSLKRALGSDFYLYDWIQRGVISSDLTVPRLAYASLPDHPASLEVFNWLNQPLVIKWQGEKDLSYEIILTIHECLTLLNHEAKFCGSATEALMLRKEYLTRILEEMGILSEEAERILKKLLPTIPQKDPNDFDFRILKERLDRVKEQKLIEYLALKLPERFQNVKTTDAPLLGTLVSMAGKGVVKMGKQPHMAQLLFRFTALREAVLIAKSKKGVFNVVTLKVDGTPSPIRDTKIRPPQFIFASQLECKQLLKSDFSFLLPKSENDALVPESFYGDAYSGILDLLFQNRRFCTPEFANVEGCLRWLISTVEGTRCFSEKMLAAHQNTVAQLPFVDILNAFYSALVKEEKLKFEQAGACLMNLTHFGLPGLGFDQSEQLFIEACNGLRDRGVTEEMIHCQPFVVRAFFKAFIEEQISFAYASSFLQCVAFLGLVSERVNDSSITLQQHGGCWQLKWTFEGKTIWLPFSPFAAFRELKNPQSPGAALGKLCITLLDSSLIRQKDNALFDLFRHEGVNAHDLLVLGEDLQNHPSEVIRHIGYKLTDFAHLMSKGIFFSSQRYSIQACNRLQERKAFLSNAYLSDMESVLQKSELEMALVDGKLNGLREIIEMGGNLQEVQITWLLNLIEHSPPALISVLVGHWKQLILDEQKGRIYGPFTSRILKKLLENDPNQAAEVFSSSVRKGFLSWKDQWQFFMTLCETLPSAGEKVAKELLSVGAPIIRRVSERKSFFHICKLKESQKRGLCTLLKNQTHADQAQELRRALLKAKHLRKQIPTNDLIVNDAQPRKLSPLETRLHCIAEADGPAARSDIEELLELLKGKRALTQTALFRLAEAFPLILEGLQKEGDLILALKWINWCIASPFKLDCSSKVLKHWMINLLRALHEKGCITEANTLLKNLVAAKGFSINRLKKHIGDILLEFAEAAINDQDDQTALFYLGRKGYPEVLLPTRQSQATKLLETLIQKGKSKKAESLIRAHKTLFFDNQMPANQFGTILYGLLTQKVPSFGLCLELLEKGPAGIEDAWYAFLAKTAECGSRKAIKKALQLVERNPNMLGTNQASKLCWFALMKALLRDEPKAIFDTIKKGLPSFIKQDSHFPSPAAIVKNLFIQAADLVVSNPDRYNRFICFDSFKNLRENAGFRGIKEGMTTQEAADELALDLQLATLHAHSQDPLLAKESKRWIIHMIQWIPYLGDDNESIQNWSKRFNRAIKPLVVNHPVEFEILGKNLLPILEGIPFVIAVPIIAPFIKKGNISCVEMGKNFALTMAAGFDMTIEEHKNFCNGPLFELLSAFTACPLDDSPDVIVTILKREKVKKMMDNEKWIQLADISFERGIRQLSWRSNSWDDENRDLVDILDDFANHLDDLLPQKQKQENTLPRSVRAVIDFIAYACDRGTEKDFASAISLCRTLFDKEKYFFCDKNLPAPLECRLYLLTMQYLISHLGAKKENWEFCLEVFGVGLIAIKNGKLNKSEIKLFKDTYFQFATNRALSIITLERDFKVNINVYKEACRKYPQKSEDHRAEHLLHLFSFGKCQKGSPFSISAIIAEKVETWKEPYQLGMLLTLLGRIMKANSPSNLKLGRELSFAFTPLFEGIKSHPEVILRDGPTVFTKLRELRYWMLTKEECEATQEHYQKEELALRFQCFDYLAEKVSAFGKRVEEEEVSNTMLMELFNDHLNQELYANSDRFTSDFFAAVHSNSKLGLLNVEAATDKLIDALNANNGGLNHMELLLRDQAIRNWVQLLIKNSKREAAGKMMREAQTKGWYL